MNRIAPSTPYRSASPKFQAIVKVNRDDAQMFNTAHAGFAFFLDVLKEAPDDAAGEAFREEMLPFHQKIMQRLITKAKEILVEACHDPEEIETEADFKKPPFIWDMVEHMLYTGKDIPEGLDKNSTHEATKKRDALIEDLKKRLEAGDMTIFKQRLN
jgi:hypothetical protein